jgi:kynureninase
MNQDQECFRMFCAWKNHNNPDLPLALLGGVTIKNAVSRWNLYLIPFGAEGWQISNIPILSLAPYLASVEMFDEIGMDAMNWERDKITCYLEYILENYKEIEGSFEIIRQRIQTRGCQLSVLLHGQGRSLFDYLMKMVWLQTGVN